MAKKDTMGEPSVEESMEIAVIEAPVVERQKTKRFVIEHEGRRTTVDAANDREAWAAYCDSHKSYPSPKSAKVFCGGVQVYPEPKE